MQAENPTKECVTLCWEARTACQDTLFNHCLYEGGKQLQPEHVKLMTDCMEICQTAADFMTRNSPLHPVICAACAEICDACAKSCDSLASELMTKCAAACRQCADSCRSLSQAKKKAA